jgi:hypothetical protein
MRGNSHVRFLEGLISVTKSAYSASIRIDILPLFGLSCFYLKLITTHDKFFTLWNHSRYYQSPDVHRDDFSPRRQNRFYREASRLQPFPYILPGFIDAHIHIESSMLIPSEFARLASVHGTVATVSDPHEIANVLGIEGVRYMIENGRQVPFRFYFGAPSCVLQRHSKRPGQRFRPKKSTFCCEKMV